jgi:S-adenosylmethionine/arginine decarboxylase-like enzyme
MLNSPNKDEEEMFGQELQLDLYECDPAIIADGAAIKKFVIELCDTVIHMKRYGEPMIPHFGHDNPITSGYSLVQLIETSNVTAHFSEYKKAVYLNVFSCAWFDVEKTTAYCQKFFKAKRVTSHLTKRE